MRLADIVGDETREILDQEAFRNQDYEPELHAQTDTDFEERRHSPEAPATPSGELRPIGTEGDKFVSSSNRNVSILYSPNVTKDESNVKRRTDEYIPQKAKRRKSAEAWGSYDGQLIGREVDGTLNGADLLPNPTSSPTKPETAADRHTVDGLAGKAGGSLREAYPTPPRLDTVSGSPVSLPVVDSDVQVLREAMLVLLKTHETEMRKLREKLYREYSRRECDRLNIILQRQEKHTVQALETKYRKEIELLKDRNNSLNAAVVDLKKQVLKERAEKAELVEACDQYLSTNGF